MPTVPPFDPPRASTGVPGLDDILAGGLPRDRLYLVQGSPGVGKTTLAIQFLRAGAAAGESCLFITLSETQEELQQVAASHGWRLDGIHLFELSSAEQTLRLDEENTLYATADVDLRETVRVLLAEVDRVRPSRVVFDSMSEIRLLAQSPMRYRRQLLALKQHFASKRSTVLLLDDRTAPEGDIQVESLVHGVISLEQQASGYGADRRRLRVTKLRGSRFRSGHHDFTVETGGVVVYPRLVAAEHRAVSEPSPLPSGVTALDDLLGGGIDRSTTTLVVGPAGTGKTVIAVQFACAAAERGEPVAYFAFEERPGTMRARASGMGLPFSVHVEAGRIRLEALDPAELAPDPFTHRVREAVEREGARVLILDSISGYLGAMPEARFLTLQLHELLSYLAGRGVATLLTLAQSGGAGPEAGSPADLSYLSDTILQLRFFEAAGRVRKAISVIKKRSGAHEDTIRELSLGPAGVHVGPPLSGFEGVLTGVPRFRGTEAQREEARTLGG